MSFTKLGRILKVPGFGILGGGAFPLLLPVLRVRKKKQNIFGKNS